MAANAELRVGVVGLGMAGALMTSVIAQHPRVTLAGAAEINPELRSNFSRDQSAPVFADLASLVRRADIDAVYIATPHQFHCEQAILAAEHGKHVIVEKPMALTLADCDAMIEAAERNRVVMIVGHTHSFAPAVGKMRELIESDAIGQVALLAMANYTDFLYRPRRPEELDTSKGGGILFNQIPHQVDIARYLVASPLKSVRAVTWILDPRRRTEGCCTALLSFANGSAASIVYSGYDHFDSDELHGWIGEGGYDKKPSHGATQRSWETFADAQAEERERGTRYGYGGTVSLAKATPKHQPHFGTLVVTGEQGDLRQSADGVLLYSREGVREIPLPAVTGRPGRAEVLDELYISVTQGKPAPHDGRFARGTVEACLAILQSAKEHREVFL
ncbi:MAG: Gfo/Idh/MocA family oxidoreductase [Steroidobacteraceae bacterium]